MQLVTFLESNAIHTITNWWV